MTLLFASAEIHPFAKSGGLADVAHALPRALAKEGITINRVMPRYSFVSLNNLQPCEPALHVTLGGVTYPIALYCLDNDNVTTYFIDAPLLSTTQHAYGDETGDYTINDMRFGIFCEAVIQLAEHLGSDVIHCNDWHTGLIPFLVKTRHLPIKTLFTIHNLAYQGLFEQSSLKRLGIDECYFHLEALEFYGHLSFMKAGIAYCDALTTVSPTYAKEIVTPEFGCGLEGFLRSHQQKLSGILNGIDTAFFDPAQDQTLAAPFDAQSLKNKLKNKKFILKTSDMAESSLPLFIMISRPVQQKGFELLIESIHALLKRPLNLIVLSGCDNEYCTELKAVAKHHPNFFLHIGYDESLSHRLYAAADFLLMPSLFEPCGLNQMIAMRYGAIPIVHSVGGLKDTVHEDSNVCGRGIIFSKSSKRALLMACDRALKLSSKERHEYMRFNMACDLSFQQSALQYINQYQTILKDPLA